MPQETENVFTEAMQGWPGEWADVIEAGRVAMLHELDEVLRPQDRAAVMQAMVWGIRHAGRQAHAARAIREGYVYDRNTGAVHWLDSYKPSQKATPAADLIDGFDFEGMDWGEDDDPARVRADQGGLDWPDELTA